MSKIQNGTKNFIYKIVNKDIILGKYKYIKTRFPPEPNGYLHIGHAKSICLNFGIAKYYNGKCNLRFDDTNPVKEKIKYIDSIKKDINWLGFKWNKNIKYSSDYFYKIKKYAVKLIKKGLAYIDQLSIKEIKKYRGTLKKNGKNSPYRNRSIKENLDLFLKMHNCEFKENSMCLRAKINMSSPYIIMRDPVLYRIRFTSHHKTGNTWCIYPMYDFAHCISDLLEGVTHSLCTLEFQNNKILYNWILKNISHRKIIPKQYEFAKLEINNTIISKRYLKYIIKKKLVKTWDDPRLLTISGLRRRGYTPNSIRNFCKIIGISKQESHINLSVLENCLRKDLNKNAIRAMAVVNPVKLIIESLKFDYQKIIFMKNHPKKPEMGTRKVLFSREIFINKDDFNEKPSIEYYRLSIGKEVRLRYACIIKAKSFIKDKNGNISTIFCCHDPNSFNNKSQKIRKLKGIIHWVSVKQNLPTEFRIYDKLLIKKRIYSYKDCINNFNKKSIKIFNGFSEYNISNIDINKNIQFEREGYFYADQKYYSCKYPVFNLTTTIRSRIKK
ncbi:MAG: glutamine--tRNA ligase/YqeY domain fusion protein [Candidatus Makana argininalis]